ncbi:MAG: helix-turn-helix domain-containing protein [Propionibacteriaceae bacterium]|jgi:transcriptional regulator with XRE-family HTH domain|nr:helix-turn-helix domain-containing protein [Propionibacteriaceae bacterium]
MVARPTSPRVIEAAESIGQQVTTWRKLLRLTATQVADRAGISRGTLRRIEQGDPGVNFAAFLSVMRALGQMDRVVTATDPYETDLGRARADHVLGQRVRV